MPALKKNQQTALNKPGTDVDFSLNVEEFAQFSLSTPNNSEMESGGGGDADKSKTAVPASTDDKSGDKPAADSSSKKKNTTNGKKAAPEKKMPYKIVPAPDGVPVVEYTVQPSKIVCFSGAAHFLSTFYKANFEMNGIRYQSVEHYYQATKLYALCGYETAARLQHIREPFKAKQTAKELLRQYRVPLRNIDAWKRSDGLVTLIYAVALKFIQNRELREQLLKTGDSLLVQTHAGDNFYAAAMTKEDFFKWAKEHEGEVLKWPYSINEYTMKHFPLIGKGQNILGAISMKIREELKKTKTEQLYDRNYVNAMLTKLTS